MSATLSLGKRAMREALRTPDALFPTLFIPLFFLAVNVGQVSKTFPSSTPFLEGQGYVAFQLPVSLMFAVATASPEVIKSYDVALPVMSGRSNRTPYVIAPNGKIVFAYTAMAPDGHVRGTRDGVKRWKARK